MKLGQCGELDIVPVFIRISSSPPIPTMHPAGALSNNFKLDPISKNKCIISNS